MTRSLIFTLMLFISTQAFGQTATPTDGFKISETIESVHLNESRQIKIKLPADYHQSKDKKYPVLYLLDGQNLQSNTGFIYDFLAGKRHIPQMIIVSIPHTGQRTRDYNTFFRETQAVNVGADSFLSFLEKEVIPHIDSTYQSSSYRMLAGHSQAGLFVFHSLIKRPELFKARFAFSPSSHDIPKQRQILQQFFKTQKNYDGYFYSNVGGTEFYQMTDAFAQTQQIFKDHAPAGLRFDFEFHEVDGHQTTPFVGQHLAFKHLYAPHKLGNDYEKMTFEKVIKHFDKTSAEFGYAVKPSTRELSSQESYYVNFSPNLPQLKKLYKVMNHYYPTDSALVANMTFLEQWFEHGVSKAFSPANAHKPQPGLLNGMGYRYLQKNDNEQALYLLKLATTLYPDQSNPYDSYAEALERTGDFKTAAKLYQQAYNIGVDKKESPETTSDYQRNHKRALTLAHNAL
jgi:predicted alpha/beta superfamily hydrolase